MDRKRCNFYILRYLPNPVRGEFLNIGVILRPHETDSSPSIQITRDWSRVICINPQADIELLGSLEEELRQLIAEEGGVAKSLFEFLEGCLSTGLELSEPRALLTSDLSGELSRLMKLYVDTP